MTLALLLLTLLPWLQAPRTTIDGAQALESVSELVYASAPGRTHSLRVSYAFPDRARLYMSVGGPEGIGERRLRYRMGARIYAQEARQPQSVEYKLEDRDTLILSLEARRALYLWPSGFAWQGNEREREAVLPALTPEGPALGRLRITLDKDGRPARLDSIDAKDMSVESLRAIVWRERNGRWLPVSHDLYVADAKVWSETLVSLSRDVRLLDAFFLPPDRRPAPPQGVQTLDLPAHRMKRVALPKDTSFAQVAELWRAERAAATEELTALGTTLENRVTVEVDAQLRPTHLLLRLATPPNSEAKAWVAIEERVGYASLTKEWPTDPAVLQKLKEACSEAPLAAPYVRFDPDAVVASFVVVQPVAP